MQSRETVDVKIQSIINTISLVSAIATFLVLIGLGFFKKHLVDRVSLRIQGAIALIDVARHLSLSTPSHSSGVICQAIAYFIRLSDLLYVLLNVAIAFNMQLILIENKRPHKRLEWLYSLISVVFAVALNLIPLAAGKFGESNNGRCRFKDDENSLWWNIFLIYMTNIPGIFYCLIVFILVTLKIRNKRHELLLIEGNEIHSQSIILDFLWTLYFRISLYPLSCVVTLFPFIMWKMNGDIKGNNSWILNLISRFSLRMTLIVKMLLI